MQKKKLLKTVQVLRNIRIAGRLSDEKWEGGWLGGGESRVKTGRH